MSSEAERRPDGIYVRSCQVYATCPKYIQTRELWTSGGRVNAGCSPPYSNGQDYSPAFLIIDLSEVRIYRVLGSR